ncbi:NAD-P-binding protein [Trametes elegans]|nr:NAD-P-binding protein [Trametes elegans]
MGSFLSKSSFDPTTDVPDLTGKVAIVTGGNAGIGFATVQHLARHGAKVYLAARSEHKAYAAIQRLHAQRLAPGRGEVVWLRLDLSDPRDALKAAQEFLQKEDRLDVLINNAALILTPFRKSHDDIQDVVMVNYISTAVFTRALLPLLKRTAQEPQSDVRIVMLNSGGDSPVPQDVRFCGVDDLNRDFADALFPQFMRYAFSKLLQYMFVRELQRRLDAQHVPITCVCAHPGVVNTEGVQAYARSVPLPLSLLYRAIAALFFATPEKGARSTVFAAAAGRAQLEADGERENAFLVGVDRTRAHPAVASVERRTELWETTEEVLRAMRVELGEV